MAKMLNVYDRGTKKKTAVLQNAYDIVETHELNKIYSLTFSLPANDEKNQYCLPRHFVRWGDNGELYRIKSPSTQESNIGIITYECEHVITTLCDTVMFGSYQYGGRGVPTATTIQWLLSQQETQDWVLDRCQFTRQFEYLWEQENLLNALYSIPKEFSKPYKWSFDTSVYPWKLSLLQINPNAVPEFYLRAKSNILSSGSAADYANICTMIYALGYGEGVNQLTIKEATVDGNGDAVEEGGTRYGLTYIQSPQSYIDKYGIVEKVLVDRRFESANSLYGYAKSMLEVYQEPTMSRSFSVTDLYPLTNYDWNNAAVGKICKMTGDGTTAYITKAKWQRDKAGDLEISLSTKANDIAQNVADLADRVRIESVYAQGATQLYQHSKDANATPDKGMILSLYFPSEMRQINKVLMRLKLGKFRAYSQTSEYGGEYSSETGENGGLNINTENGGGIETNTKGGGAVTKDTGGGGAVTKDTGGGGAVTKDTGGGGAGTFTSRGGGAGTISSLGAGAGTITSGDGGGIDTTTGSSGGGSGQTGVNSGGSGISLSPSISVSVSDTEDANWYNKSDITTSKTGIGGFWIVTASSAGSSHNHSVWGYTGTVTPPESDNYKHDHAINFTTDQDEGGFGGSHSHQVYEGNGSQGHSHTFTRGALKHKHGVNYSISVNVINTEEGQTNFSHTHPFYVADHTHSISLSNHTHNVTLQNHTHNVTLQNHTHSISLSNHTHSISLSNHTHSISLSNHTHPISLSNHTHPIKVNDHKHSITIPSHSHAITPGIYEYGNPTKFDIFIDRKKAATVDATSYDGDITSWLLNNNNLVPRDTWIDVEIVPNDKAYVQASVFVQGFVQSRGGGNY